jgi:colanic acid biosynthesis glycosyl transferase WcaI
LNGVRERYARPPESRRQPKLLALYHYLPPDDTVSARLFGELCAGLVMRGWSVDASPSNRAYSDEAPRFPTAETIDGVRYRRVWRPPFREATSGGRLANSAWMTFSWSLRAARLTSFRPDVLLVGTDPVLAVLAAIPWRRLRPRVKIVHWAFDLYPEAAIADGLLEERSPFVRAMRSALGSAYRSCDLVVDIGPCMRERLDRYAHHAERETIVPWALSEPGFLEPDPDVRRSLFGDARLAVLYSGNFGRAHSHEPFFDLARRLRGERIHFAFGIRGNRAATVCDAVGPDDHNISLAGYAREDEVATRLTAADIHLASLQPPWTGIAVPSKFFGSLAAGRPVLFAGPRESAIAKWIEQHDVGWVLDDSSAATITEELRSLAVDPGRLRERQRRCLEVYDREFARERLLDRWDRTLRALLNR